ncbi:hypothetical protein [Rhizobium leguminosarum]|uniref:hypothetical protein n=1 Tax=Rhizobium leguminosarum TaxID=384 RepID=UPI0021BC10BD|nr:hypothetical protein [Rhizobium leguminosarum]
MTEMTKELVVARLANMRGEILSKIQPQEQRDETETPPEQPYVFLRQRVENRERLFCLSVNLLNAFRM